MRKERRALLERLNQGLAIKAQLAKDTVAAREADKARLTELQAQVAALQAQVAELQQLQ